MADSGLKSLFVLSDKYHGRGRVLFSWNADGTFLCTAGSNGLVYIFDRHGERVCDVLLESKAQATAVEWDKDGEAVVIVQANVDRVAVWELASRTVLYIDTNMKDITFAKWSKTGPQLALGSAKGALTIFRKDTRKKVLLTGKHSKAITCGDWSSATNKLALGGADVMLTISTPEGDTDEQIELKYAPAEIQFAAEKTDSSAISVADTTVSVNMGGNTILLYNLLKPTEPAELLFQQRYGRIVAYRWFGDGYVMIGFSEGYVVVISTHKDEIKEEVFSGRFHREALTDIACSVTAQRAASAGGNTIRLLDMHGWKELKTEFASVDAAHGPIESLQWTADGQILTAATRSGHLYAFLGKVPTVVDAWFNRVAYMSSLREVSVTEVGLTSPIVTFPVALEPDMISLGPYHVAVGMNNKVWYHRIDPVYGSGGKIKHNAGTMVAERDYLGSVDDIKLGAEHAAVLSSGKVYLHTIANPGDLATQKTLPEKDVGARVTCVAIANNFVFYGLSNGRMEVYSLLDAKTVASAEYHGSTHSGAGAAALPSIKAVYPNALGTRVVIIDQTGRAVLFNPVNGKSLHVSIPEGTKRVMWDAKDKNVFIAATDRDLATFLYTPRSMTGPKVDQLGALAIQQNGDMVVEPVTTAIPSGVLPLLAADGVVVGYSSSSSLATVFLRTHDALASNPRPTPEYLRSCLAQNIALLRLNAAWDAAVRLNDRSCWMALSGKAMEVMELDLAQRVYRQVGDAGMVAAIDTLTRVEDRAAAAGHMALLFGDYNLAQDLFLASSQPLEALEMRKDLLQWDTALKLAETLAPHQVSSISLEYGKQLEFKGEYPASLELYQRASSNLHAVKDLNEAARIKSAVQSGIARMTLRQGELRKGIQLAVDSGDKQLCKECAAILESMKQYPDAANLYKAAEMWDKAVALLLTSKNFAAAAPLMEKITTPKLHAIYAKAKEAAKEYLEAARAYERARDMDSVVRLLIDHLASPERAASIVRQTRSSESATHIAKYCTTVGDFRGAIEFLLLAKKSDDAFQLACQYNEMGLYVQALRISLAATAVNTDPTALLNAAASKGDAAAAALAEVTLPPAECARIAQYYESKGDVTSAAAMYSESAQYQKAMKLYLQGGDAFIDKAIDVVGKAKQEAVTHMLIDFLMGESDGVPKDPRYIFKLYLALGNYVQAAKTAIIIARQEQELGNYKVAHGMLFDTYIDLEAHAVRIPSDLTRYLTLLHSYLLVKRLVKQENHEAAAHMMLRVAKNVSRFPAHVVPILTSVVIECHRAGLKRSGAEYAAMLMRPEYRDLVEPKFKKKIEAIVRRPSEEQADEPLTPCPFCDKDVPAYQLNCHSCKANLPFCVVTGRHMTLDDCSCCPNCRFPALYSSLASYLTMDTTCPMCSQNIVPASIQLVREPMVFLRKAAGATEDGGDDEGVVASSKAGAGT